jgi:hypothetical protein
MEKDSYASFAEAYFEIKGYSKEQVAYLDKTMRLPRRGTLIERVTRISTSKRYYDDDPNPTNKPAISFELNKNYTVVINDDEHLSTRDRNGRIHEKIFDEIRDALRREGIDPSEMDNYCSLSYYLINDFADLHFTYSSRNPKVSCQDGKSICYSHA